MVTNIQNFKMSTYLELSCAYNGHWLLPCVAWLSLCYNLAIWLHCDLGQPGEPLCVDSLTLSTYQVLIVLTLLAYLAVLSDLATGKIKRLLAGTGLAQIRDTATLNCNQLRKKVLRYCIYSRSSPASQE